MKKNDYSFYKELILQEIPNEPCGKHHREIAHSIGLKPTEARDIIRMLRDDGVPICSNSNDGYWIARTSDEIQKVINMFASYITSMQDTMVALEMAKLEKLKEEGRL